MSGQTHPGFQTSKVCWSRSDKNWLPRDQNIQLIQMLIKALCLWVWGQSTGFGMGGISLAETLGTAVLPCFDFRDMRNYSSLFFWDMDYIPKSSRYISPYSFTTMELFHAEKSQQPKLIKLIPSFLQCTHFCQPLCWLQRLSDPARS